MLEEERPRGSIKTTSRTLEGRRGDGIIFIDETKDRGRDVRAGSVRSEGVQRESCR